VMFTTFRQLAPAARKPSTQPPRGQRVTTTSSGGTSAISTWRLPGLVA
jgi:hypothetical protein